MIVNASMSNTRIHSFDYTICPYFGRAFHQTTTIPQMGECGGLVGQGIWADKESCLRPCHLRQVGGCTDSVRYPDGLLFNWLPTEWQQADIRPLTFTNQSRIEIKDQCRFTPGCDQNCAPCYSSRGHYVAGNPRAMSMADISVFTTKFV